MHSAAKTYFQTQFSTMDQGEVLLLLYDGALKFLAQAREYIERKEIVAKGNAISKAIDVINELDASLNLEVGGELAKNLHQLYFICTTRLLSANLKMDIAQIDSVVEILTGLRGAYAEIVNRPEAQAASQHIAAKQKAFDNSRQAAAAPNPAPASIGGARAHMAYTTAAMQTAEPVPANAQAGQTMPDARTIPASSQTQLQPSPLDPPVPLNRSASFAAYGKAAQQVQS